MHISARHALSDMLKACEALNGLAEMAIDHSKKGLPLPVADDDRGLLLRAMTLLYSSVETLTPLILETNYQANVTQATASKFALHPA